MRLDLLLADSRREFSITPALAGVLVAATMVVSAFASKRAIAVRDRLGVAASLIGAMLLQALIMLAMALVVHPLVIALLLLRGVPRAIATPVQNAVIHPRLHRGIRATFLSLQSLAGRLAFSGSLWIAAVVMPTHDTADDAVAMSHPDMAAVLIGFTVAAVAVALLLAACSRAVRAPENHAVGLQSPPPDDGMDATAPPPHTGSDG